MSEPWPSLPLKAWQATYDTLHMWTQMAGKVRLALSPPVNHWWSTALYVTPRGLTTSSIPYENRCFDLSFDFLDHRLIARTSEGIVKSLALESKSVAKFYREIMALLRSLDMDVKIDRIPQEFPNPIPFDE